MKNITEYSIIAFDCDGVILNSNKIKTEAFYKLALDYGEDEARMLLAFHIKNGGISRYKKIDYFFSEILMRQPQIDERQFLLEKYANYVKKRLITCEVDESIKLLREITSSSSWMVVSGGDQLELREIFSIRHLDVLFNLGIFGSPTPKEDIICLPLNKGFDSNDILFIGDSAYDYKVASSIGADFVFVHHWTEMLNWPDFVKANNIKCIESLRDLIH